MDICDIGVYNQFCYTGKTCKADKRQCLSTYYIDIDTVVLHVNCYICMFNRTSQKGKTALGNVDTLYFCLTIDIKCFVFKKKTHKERKHIKTKFGL